ncbi:exosortase A [Neiella sp. HB171785]|uniref:Exosortase A n=1 Tax=Neiella litorisoli TaxID=2771431 RepID=A0A8J6QJY0_9GAMM|nr:exosortase A [Neiella litorisoli]MBD1390534.1 exosortase A [Neiella litorisoli]
MMNASSNRTAIYIAFTIVTIWLLAFHQDLLSMAAVWQRSETFAHGYIIYPIAIWLIWRRRFLLQEANYQAAPIMAIPLFGCSLFWLAADVASVQVAAQLAAVVWLPLTLWMVLGHNFARICWFPCCYLLFAVPLGEELIPQLQLITADITVYLLGLTQIPVFREGLYISVPGGLFEVAVACSGIRYLISSIALGTLFAHLQFVSPLRQLGFVILSVLVPIVANGIRAYLIVLLAYMSDMQLATGVDHIIYGWFFFGIVMFILFWIGSFWRQAQADPPAKARKTGHYALNGKQYGILTIAALSLLLPAIYLSYIKNMTVPSYQVNSNSLGQSFEPGELSSWQPRFANADAYYQGVAANQAEIYLALYNSSRQDKELVNFNHKLFDDEIWTPEGSKIIHDQFGSYRVVRITRADSQKMDVLFWYQLSSVSSASQSRIKLQQAFDTLLARPNTGAAIVLAAPRNEHSLSELQQVRQTLLALPAIWHQ